MHSLMVTPWQWIAFWVATDGGNLLTLRCVSSCFIFSNLQRSGPSSQAPMNNSGQGFRMYRPTKSSIGGQTTSTQEKSNITSKELHPVRQARGLGDGWPGPLGSDRGNGMSGGSKQWTRAPLHTMEALIVSTPAMSGEGNINLMVNSVISGVSFIVTIAF